MDDVVVIWLKASLFDMGNDVDTTLLGINPDCGARRAFNKPDIRMKISVGAMPCAIGVSSQQRISIQVTNTHEGLHGNSNDDAHAGVAHGTKNAGDKLHNKIEHAALNGYGDGSPTRSCREICARHVVSSAWGEVPDPRDDEGSHNCVPAQ